MTKVGDMTQDSNLEQPLFEYYAPKSTMKGILSIPHSGEIIPQEFDKYLQGTKTQKMQDLDFRVHELVDIEALRESGIGVIKANISRITVDLNRSPEKALFAWKNNSRGVQIVKEIPNQSEAKKLLSTYYSPYFEMLKALMHELSKHVTKPSIIDLHSMPSKATDYHLKITPDQPKIRPDFCLSDKSGVTCESKFISNITTLLRSDGSDATNNMPYYGGYLTEFIQSEVPQGNNIQIEISRALYMDEEKIELIEDKVTKLKAHLTQALCKHYTDYFN